jgi:hypothetical protein
MAISHKQAIAVSLIQRRLTLSEFTYELEQHRVQVVQPGKDTPMLFYHDHRRFFPVLNSENRVVGGHFG